MLASLPLSPLPVPQPPPPSTEDTPLAPPQPQGKMGPRLQILGPAEPSLPGPPQSALSGETPGGVGAGCGLPAALLGTRGFCDQPPSLPSSRGHCCAWETCPRPLGFVSLSHLCSARAPGAHRAWWDPSALSARCKLWVSSVPALRPRPVVCAGASPLPTPTAHGPAATRYRRR